MNEKTTLITPRDDDHIDKNNNSSKKDITYQRLPDISADSNKSRITMPWNWRLETDTAEVFLTMFG